MAAIIRADTTRLPLWLFLFALTVSCADQPQAGSGGTEMPDLGMVDIGFEPDDSYLGRDAGNEIGLSCLFPLDCEGGDCIDGRCVFEMPSQCGTDTECGEGEVCSRLHFGYCAKICELQATCKLRPRPCAGTACPRPMTCVQGTCINECITDAECGTGHCQKGYCRPFPDVLSDVMPSPVGQQGQMYGGRAVKPFRFPLGVSLAGFIGRGGPETPYADALGGSDLVFERQDVRALVLSSDSQLVIMLRIPLAWSTDYLRTLTALKLQALTRSEEHPKGINYLDHLVMFATHSHSQPARFWHLLPELGVGSFGFGTFSNALTEMYAETFAQVIYAALQDMQPVRVGWSVLDDVDPERRIHANRRPQGPPVLDDRLMLLRVEDLAGKGIAAIVNFAIHGTHMNDSWVTGDVAAGIERVATRHLSRRYNQSVPVLFANGNAGNVNPQGSDVVTQSYARIQLVGHRLWPIIERAWAQAIPSAELAFEHVTRRIPITYERLGYDRSVPDFRDDGGAANVYGGYFCLDDSPPPSGYVDGALGCLIQPDMFGWPLANIHKTVLSAIRLGSLVIATLPGEPTSSLGLGLARQIEDAAREAGVDDVRAISIGYSQDHQLYLLEPEDWWMGGYEARNNWFGWNLGRYIAGESAKLADQLFTQQREPNETGVKPMLWPDMVTDHVMPTMSQGSVGGTLFDEPDGSMRRGQLVEFSWEGGHPGVDLPKVGLERLNDASWAAVLGGAGEILGDGGFESLLAYHGDYVGDHRWSLAFELPLDIEVGTFRFRVDGSAVEDDGAVASYTVSTSAFEVTPAQLRVVECGGDDTELYELCVNLPDGPRYSDTHIAFDGVTPLGTIWRHGNLNIPTGARQFAFVLGGPLLDGEPQVRCQLGDGEVVLIAETSVAMSVNTRPVMTGRRPDGTTDFEEVANWPTSRIRFDRTAAYLECTVSDRDGNSGTVRF